jgi:hypothetical protein
MTLEELQQIAGVVQPLPPDQTGQARLEETLAYNDNVSLFRELLVRARNSLVQGKPVPDGLARDLRILVKSLPAKRSKVAAGRAG